MSLAATSGKLPAVDAYIAKCQPFAQPILEHLRAILHEAAPGVEEAIKWSHPFFLYRGIILANLAGFKGHCSLGLWGQESTAELRRDGVASGGVASDGGMGSFGRIASLEDLPPRKQILGYVRGAVRKIDDGTRTRSLPARTRVAKPPAEVPEALAAALGKNKAAAAKFEAMSPSCRREYCDWIASAKRDETRDKRVREALGMIAEGKSRNWKYVAS